MAIHAQRELFSKSIVCGQSFTLLGCQSRYGAGALAASVSAVRNSRNPVWCPPPKRAGLVLRGEFRLRPGNQRTGIEMRAIVTAAAMSLGVKTTWLPNCGDAENGAKNRMSPTPFFRLAAQRRTGMAVYVSNLILCLSLWMSLFVAIWVTRGWIGLLFSGQLFSAGAKLFKTLSKRTQYAFSAGNVPAHELEVDRDE
jgi:hypothetical protein